MRKGIYAPAGARMDSRAAVRSVARACWVSGVSFAPCAGEVEDVDGGFAFGVDERDLDVALVGAEGEAIWREKAGHVLGDDLQQRGVRGRLGVELQARGDLDLDVVGVVHVAARLEQLLDGDLLRDHVVKVVEEAVSSRWGSARWCGRRR